MTQEIIKVPDLKFGMYYPDILESLLDFKRVNVPELSDESEFEPHIQFLRAVAATQHQSHVLLDVAAQESLQETARLVESVRAHLKSQGYSMRSAQPSKATLIVELSRVLPSASVVVPQQSKFSTERDQVSNVTVYFESDEDVSSTPTDVFSAVHSTEDGIWVEHTASANSASSPGTDWTPWGVPESGDALYFCHDSVMWDRLDSYVTTETDPGSGFGVWEYYNGDVLRARPDSVEQINSRIRMVVNSYVGEANRQGTILSVRLNSTLTTEEATVVWDGNNNVVEVSLLGQSEVSTATTAYTIGSLWEEVSGLSSDSGVGDLYLGVEDQISWEIPQNLTQNWRRATFEGVDGYWLRFRWIEAPTSGPTFRYIRMTEGKQYIATSVTQGRTYTDSPLGSSDGTPDQTFESSKSGFIDNGQDELIVDNAVWTRVEDFLSSTSTDQHYVVELAGESSAGVVKFGNGSNGQIPETGLSNIIWTYRYDALTDGNVGSQTIVKDQSSLTLSNRVWNPRQAVGWSADEGSTAESLQRAKQLAAKQNQTKGVAVSGDDLIPLTISYTDDEGSSIFARAFAIEEAFGPKTVGLVVMASGAQNATEDQLADLEAYFNGDATVTPAIKKKIVQNQQLTAMNFETRSIDVEAVVTAKGVTVSQIKSALTATLSPNAKDENGNWIWEFGDLVSASKLSKTIHDVSSNISTISMKLPTSDIRLGGRELPTVGTLNITVVQPKAVS